MKIILIKKPDQKLGIVYKPENQADKMLMQHLMHDDYIAITDISLVRARCVAEAHGWNIEIK